MKIGIFGGTFSPPHNAHRNIAIQAKEQLGLDMLFVLPCGDPYHKHCDVDKDVRFELARLAFQDIALVSDYEIRKEGATYTVDTLHYFCGRYPQAEFYLIMGGDSFVSFDTWRNPQEIAALATLAVVCRDGLDMQDALKRLQSKFKVSAVFLKAEQSSVSSSEIRLRYQFGMNNSQFVPPIVDNYIKKNALYCEYREMAAKLKEYLPPKRYEHTFYVVKRGLEFASSAEYDKVFTACLLHDAAKYVKLSDYAKYGYVRNASTPGPVIHAYLGEKVAAIDFGICDKEILDAIKYHTTARPNMTRLDKIVYVADKTEQTRPYPLDHLLKGTLDEIFVKCLIKANEYKDKAHKDGPDDPLTEQALKFYTKKN